MNNNPFRIFLFIFIFAAVVAALDSFYVIDETKQAVITQFGEPMGTPVTDPGMHFKLPIVQKVNYFEKRILPWDGDANQIPTLDKRYIWVDTTARWRIVDALKFMQSVGTARDAQARLDDIIYAATRDTISNSLLVEAVRSSNRLLDVPKEERDAQWVFDIGNLERIKEGREALTEKIAKQASEIMPRYGIELIDVLIKRIDYVDDVRKKVYDRMISERLRTVEQFRSEGQGKKAEIEGQTQKELKRIQSEAYRKSQEIKGRADAEAIRIYADSYNHDPEFYSFLKTLDTYSKVFDSDTSIILGTDNDFFKYLKSADPDNAK